jgi:cytochrome b pre-mRNA-processing protein 3
MLDWLKARRSLRRTARELYGSIVTQARQPQLYAGFGVPDTMQGRFEMVAMHLVLILQRLESEGARGRRVGRFLTESFVVDMDDGMREMTFGDLAVPLEVKRALAALFDRHKAYRGPLASGDRAALQAALAGQLAYLAPSGRLDAGQLAHYMCDMSLALGRQSGRDLLEGRLAWPPADGPGETMQ